MKLIYSTQFIASKAYLPGSLTLLDDWLKRDRFVFIGWSGLLLFPTAYLAAVKPLAQCFTQANPIPIHLPTLIKNTPGCRLIITKICS